MKYCPNCGRELADNMKFCGGCGTSQKEAKLDNVKSKKSKRKVFLLVLVMVVIVGAAVVGIFFLRNEIRKTDNEVEKVNVQEEHVTETKMAEELDEEANNIESSADVGTETVYLKTEMREYFYRTDAVELKMRNKYEYDNHGNVLKSEQYIEEKLNYVYEYTYNDKGGVSNEVRYVYDENGEEEHKSEYMYDELGNQISLRSYGVNGELEYEWKSVYDEFGNLINMQRYDVNGERELGYKFAYDGQGNQISKKLYGVNGELESEWKYIYDENKNKINVLFYDANGKLKYEDKFVYDEYGNEIIEQKYDSNGELEYQYKATYNDFSDLLKEFYYYDNELHSSIEYVYDEDRNCLGYTEYWANGEKSRSVEYEWKEFEIHVKD